MQSGRLIVPVVKSKPDGSVFIEQGTYTIRFNPEQTKAMIADFHAR
jgi:hypothetical protein